jgi:hypothetical protein
VKAATASRVPILDESRFFEAKALARLVPSGCGFMQTRASMPGSHLLESIVYKTVGLSCTNSLQSQ